MLDQTDYSRDFWLAEWGQFAQQHPEHADVRFGSKADIGVRPQHVALPPKADMDQHGRDVRYVPEAEVARKPAIPAARLR